MIRPKPHINRIAEYPSLTEEEQELRFPFFFNKLKFEKFRSISNLEIDFRSPITVLTGNNRCGKTTVLLAIACSHYNFQKKDFANGTYSRNTWGHLMRFTAQDIQTEDWTYHVSYRNGNKPETKRGQRKFATKKWNGVEKKNRKLELLKMEK